MLISVIHSHYKVMKASGRDSFSIQQQHGSHSSKKKRKEQNFINMICVDPSLLFSPIISNVATDKAQYTASFFSQISPGVVALLFRGCLLQTEGSCRAEWVAKTNSNASFPSSLQTAESGAWRPSGLP